MIFFIFIIITSSLARAIVHSIHCDWGWSFGTKEWMATDKGTLVWSFEEKFLTYFYLFFLHIFSNIKL